MSPARDYERTTPCWGVLIAQRIDLYSFRLYLDNVHITNDKQKRHDAAVTSSTTSLASSSLRTDAQSSAGSDNDGVGSSGRDDVVLWSSSSESFSSSVKRGGRVDGDGAMYVIKNKGRTPVYVDNDRAQPLGPGERRIIFTGARISVGKPDEVYFVFKRYDEEMGGLIEPEDSKLAYMTRINETSHSHQQVGSMGTIHSYRTELHGGNRAVLRVTDKKLLTSKCSGCDYLKEIEILSRLRGLDAFETLLEYRDTPANLFVMTRTVSESGESLNRYLLRSASELAQTKEIFFQIFAALKYLHSNQISHNNMNFYNVEIRSAHVVLTGFTFAFSSLLDNHPITLPRRHRTLLTPPEAVKADGIVYTRARGPKMDVYRAGTMLRLAAKPKSSVSFSEDSFDEDFGDFAQIQSASSDCLKSAKFQDLVNKTTFRDPSKRCSSEEALQSEWFHF